MWAERASLGAAGRGPTDRGEQVLEELRDQMSSAKSPFIGRVGPESTARLGQRAELAVDTRKPYFFDPATWEARISESGVAAVSAAGERTA